MLDTDHVHKFLKLTVLLCARGPPETGAAWGSLRSVQEVAGEDPFRQAQD